MWSLGEMNSRWLTLNRDALWLKLLVMLHHYKHSHIEAKLNSFSFIHLLSYIWNLTTPLLWPDWEVSHFSVSTAGGFIQADWMCRCNFLTGTISFYCPFAFWVIVLCYREILMTHYSRQLTNLLTWPKLHFWVWGFLGWVVFRIPFQCYWKRAIFYRLKIL